MGSLVRSPLPASRARHAITETGHRESKEILAAMLIVALRCSVFASWKVSQWFGLALFGSKQVPIG